ncbi:MAG: 4Fe-4S dicluster domain-containing protein [Oscillospiraceae bacterium]|nr:4Fe-4S dicluster domain-containing protein [Oscillospiraceae bacterium]
MKKIVIDEEKCKACEICITVCPKKILETDKNKINKKGYHPVGVTDPDSCISCAMCAVVCPHIVITVNK